MSATLTLIGFVVVCVLVFLIVRFRNPIIRFIKIFFGSLLLAIAMYILLDFIFGILPTFIIPIIQAVAILGNIALNASSEEEHRE